MTSLWRQERAAAPETSRLIVERAHDELLAGHADDARLGDVRSLIRDSWRRSLGCEVPADGIPDIDLGDDELRAYREAHPLAAALPAIRRLLGNDTDDPGVIVAVGDAMGRLMWVEGDRGLRDIAARMGFIAGANWSERSVGTSAPGTALALDAGVQVHTAEHYNRLVQPWSCTAAPVHDPETHRLLGVIDVTGGTEVVTPQALLLVEAAARVVESELLVARLRSRAHRPRRAGANDSARTPVLTVLGRDRALLDAAGGAVELTARHSELLLLIASHAEGLTAQELAALIYDDPNRTVTLRAELVRLGRVLERSLGAAALSSRPYRLLTPIETDAQQVRSLLGRGAHRAALAAYPGPVLPGSTAPGVEALRDSVRAALVDTLLADASVDVLAAFACTATGQEEPAVLAECLRLLPPRSPKRQAIVARLEALRTA